MENVYIRIRFSSFMKDISKSTSKFSLEIVPLVSCIENFDKIKWKQKKDKIEYIVPISYKIIIKKLKVKSVDGVKSYYSCVDLLPSSLSKVDLSAGDICRVISENLILNKKRNDFTPLKHSLPLDIKFKQTANHIKQSTNSNDRTPLKVSNSAVSEPLKTMPLTEQNEAPKQKLSGEADINVLNVDKSTSNQIDFSEIKTKATAHCQKSTETNYNRKFHITPERENIQQICTKDTLPDRFKRNMENSSIACLFNELDLLKHYNMNARKHRTLPLSPNHNHHSYEKVLISNIRIRPEVRVAKFVENMEKEILPLKLTLNNIIGKCSSLGLNEYILTNNPFLDKNVILETNKLVNRNVQREINYNRVVYSIVFDE